MKFKRIPSMLVLLAVLFLASQTMIVGDVTARPLSGPLLLDDDGGDNGDPGQGEKLVPDPVILLSSKTLVFDPTVKDLFTAELMVMPVARPIFAVPTVFAPKVQLPGLVFSIELLSEWIMTR